MADPPSLPDSLPPDPPISSHESLHEDEESNQKEDHEPSSSNLGTRTGPSMSDVVLQVKPRSLSGSKSASEVVGGARKPRAGNFSSRLKKIKETRTRKDSGTAEESTTSTLSHSTSTPAVIATPTIQSLQLPDIQEHDESLNTSHDSTIEETPTKDTTEDKTVRKESVHVYDSIEEPPLEPPAHIYDTIVPGDPRDDVVVKVPPLPVTPPPKITPLTTPTTASPLSDTTVFSYSDVATETRIPSRDASFTRQEPPFPDGLPEGPPLPSEGPPLPVEGPPPSLEGPPVSVIEQPSLPLEEPSLPLKEPLLPLKKPPLPSEGPPLPSEDPPLPSEEPPLPSEGPPLPSEGPPPLPPDDPPPLPINAPPTIQESPHEPSTVTPPLNPLSSDIPPVGHTSIIKDLQSPLASDSPYLSPGYVQFSTQGSSEGLTTAGSSSVNVGSSITSFTSYTTEPPSSARVMGGAINRPVSVSSLVHHHEQQPFQSNLKKWKFTNLTDETDKDLQSSSLPSSGNMRRVQSNIDKTIMHSSSGGIDQSLDSITESHTPLTTPTPSPPSIIQRRLTTGDIDNHEVTITQVAKTRWSLVISEETGQPVPSPLPQDKAPAEIEIEKPSKLSTNAELREDNKQSKRPKKALSLNENSLWSGKHRHGNSDLYDTEGSPEGEGNLHKINQGIPKSLSSLFDSVVSDIPGLASSDEEEESVARPRIQEKGAGPEPAPTKAKELDKPKKSPKLSSTKKAVKLPTNAVNAPSKAPPTTKPIHTDQQKKPEHQSDSKTNVAVSNVPNVVHKRNVVKRSETLKPMKVFMQKIHPGLMYKMFMIGTSTMAHDVVEQGLEKANIIDDPRCFALYVVYDSTNEIVRVLQDQDCPLSSGGNTSSAPTHLELRRFRVHQSKSIQISTEFLSSVKKRSIQLTISPSTTAREVTLLCLRKLQLYYDVGSDSDMNKYKMMVVDMKASEEWLIDDKRCVLNEMRDGCSLAVVDIEQYLMKGKGERLFMEQALPDDPHVMKAILKESNAKIDNLHTDVLLKDHMIKQLREKLESTSKVASQEMESLEPLKVKYKQLQESSAKEIQELQAELDKAKEEAKEKEQNVANILSGIEAQYKSITNKNTTMQRSVAAAKNEMEKLIEEKQVAVWSLEASLSQKDEIITELNSEMEVMRTSLSGEGLNQILQSNEGRNEAEAEAVSRLERRVQELENENEELRATPTDKKSNLFHLMRNGKKDVLKHLVIIVEAAAAVPDSHVTTLSIDTVDDGMCVVKSIAEASSVYGILESGDRLIEVNGCMVLEDIVGMVSGHLTGPLQIVASREIVSLEIEERLSEQEVVNGQLQKDNEKLKAELDSLLAELESAKNLLQENQIERDLLEKQLKQQQSSSDTNGHVNDIHRLRDQLTCSTDPVTDNNESLADTLKDSEKQEILDVLRTVETDCLNCKQSFERLLEVVVSNSPELLEIIANNDQKSNTSAEEGEVDGWC